VSARIDSITPVRCPALALPGEAMFSSPGRARARAMIDAGLLQECRSLVERGYTAELRPLQAIGYRHVMPVVEGTDTLVNALHGMQRDTRHFARRQRTWFRAVAEAVWLDPGDFAAIESRVRAFLESAAPRYSEGAR